MARRGLPPVAEQILTQDAARRGAQQALQEKQARRNALAKEIGQAKRSGANSAALEAEGFALRDEMAALEAAAAAAEAAQTASWKHCRTFSTPMSRMARTNPLTSCCTSMASRPAQLRPKQHFELARRWG